MNRTCSAWWSSTSRKRGFEAHAVGTGAEGIASALKTRPAVVILDLMLPDIPGAEVCRRMRLDPSLADVPIMMLTARGDEYDRVLGFEVGADDYVVKPFSVRELVLRVRAVMRRAKERQAARTAVAGTAKPLAWRGLEVDLVHHRVYADGAELALRPLEFKLIAVLLEAPGRVFTRARSSSKKCGERRAISIRAPSIPMSVACARSSALTARP